MKICNTCNVEKQISEYHKHTTNADRLNKRCKQCRNQDSARRNQEKRRDPLYLDKLKDRELRRKYGISLETYNRQCLEQNNVCAICNEFCIVNERLCVDHDHNSGKVRGFLCSRCNQALGLFRDSEYNLINAVKYLRK